MIKRLPLIATALLFLCSSARAQTATINWTNVHQQMDGWGAEDWAGTDPSFERGSGGFVLNSTEVGQFFSTTSGIGLQFIRTRNYSCPTTGACSVSTANVPDLVTLQLAVAFGAKVTVAVQPPANLQTGGNFEAGTADPTSGSCVPSSNFGALASFQVSWIQMLQANSVPVYDLEVANEPDLTTNSGGGCKWTAAGFDTYIKNYLGPAMASAGLTTKIAMPQESGWFGTGLQSTCLTDSGCASYVSIANSHGYGSGSQDGMGTSYCCHTATAPPADTAGKHVWMSETNGGFTYDATSALWLWDASMADALVWARSIHDYLTIGNVNAWFYWELVDECAATFTGGCANGPLNDGLSISNGGAQSPVSLTFSKRYYTVGQWSKLVRNGYYRVDSTLNPQAGVYVTAFRDVPSATIVIVAVNKNSSNTSQGFSATNAPSFSSLIPYVTSASLNLAAQTSTPVSNNSFAYALPANSVTTFVGSAATVQPPTNVVATPH